MFSRMFAKREFIDWRAYKSMIDFIDELGWQQSVRRESMRNIH